MFYLMSLYLMLMSIYFIIFFILFLSMKLNILIEWSMLMFNSMNIEFILFFDWISMLFISTIFLISSMVMLYSIEYMNNDLFIKRFMMLILIFIMSMIFMILSPNMISILLGWDGLGLSSYCLVIYYQNKKSYISGMVTILMNRVGDISILMLISLLLFGSSWNLLFLKILEKYLYIFLFLMVFTKSAQIPFSSWLPMAMAAPTPVSSLVHSSTLVTAGIYILIRFSYLLNMNFNYFLMMISLFTMLMSSLSASVEYDLKKIIALSTLSQLGLMFFTISISLPLLAFFHLITHAMFKSLLFLCSGIIIHNYFNNQDIRYISMMKINMPLINIIFMISSLTLCGMPFLTGFYSKDFIIEMFSMKFSNLYMYMITYMCMGLTMSYSIRLIYFISLSSIKIFFYNKYNMNNLMNYSIILLLFMSVFYGSVLNWLIFNSLMMIFLPKSLKILIYKIILINFMISLFISFKMTNFLNMLYFNKILYFFNSMWFFNVLLKKNKILLNNMIMNLNNLKNMSWLEYFLILSFFNLMKFIIFKKKIKMINFFFMFLMMIYLLILLMFF